MSLRPSQMWTFALAMVLIFGCGNRPPIQGSIGKNDLVIALPFELTTIDPAKATEGRAFDVLRQVYECLVGLDVNGGIIPGIAESWTVTDQGRLYRFRLRKGVVFHDGRRLTAQDVSATYDRICSPMTASPLGPDYLSDIVGSQDVVRNRSRHILGVSVKDAQTIEIRLVQAKSSFLSKIAYPVCSIVPAGTGQIQSATEMVGSGPFTGERLNSLEFTLVKNPVYWGGVPTIDRIHYRFVIDPGTRLNLFRHGDVDLASVAPSDVPAIRNNSALRNNLKITPRADLAYLQFNATTLPVLNETKVRRALALCIDRDRLVQNMMASVPQAAFGLIPPGVPGYESQPGTVTNPDVARKLLTEAGFPGGRGFPPIDIVFQDTQRDNPVAEAIATAWRKELGIDAGTRALPAPALREGNLSHRIPCFLTAWVGDYPDPDDFVSTLLRTGSSANGSSYCNLSVDQLLDQADSSSETASRLTLYRQAEHIALDSAPIVPLMYLSDAELVSNRVRRLGFCAFGHLSLASVSLQPRM